MEIVNTLMPFIKALLVSIIGFIGIISVITIAIVLFLVVFWGIIFFKIWKESE